MVGSQKEIDSFGRKVEQPSPRSSVIGGRSRQHDIEPTSRSEIDRSHRFGPNARQPEAGSRQQPKRNFPIQNRVLTADMKGRFQHPGSTPGSLAFIEIQQVLQIFAQSIPLILNRFGLAVISYGNILKTLE